MIIQGSNEPIIVDWTDINLEPTDTLSISLRNEIEELKHWAYADCTIETADKRILAPIDEEESIQWEPCRCVIEAKWLDDDGNTIFCRARDRIVRWDDHRILGGDGGDV